MFSNASLRRFKTLLTLEDPPSLRPGMRVDNAEVAGLKVRHQDLDAIRGGLAERERSHRRAMFAAMVIGGVGFDAIQPRRTKRFERDAVRPRGLLGVGQRGEFVDVPHRWAWRRRWHRLIGDHGAARLTTTLRRILDTSQELRARGNSEEEHTDRADQYTMHVGPPDTAGIPTALNRRLHDGVDDPAYSTRD